MIIARNRRSNEKYLACTSDPTCIHDAIPSQVFYLHYVDGHTQPYHFLIAESHERPHHINVHSKNLAVSIARHTDKFEIELRSILEFNTHLARRKTESALSGACAERYHYSSLNKDVVCRCNKRKHQDHKTVKNQQIWELCVRFFQLNSTKTTCTRKQWRIVKDAFLEPSMTSLIPEKNSTKEVRRASTLNQGFLDCDSTSRIGSLKRIDEHSQNPNDHWSCPPLCPFTSRSMENLKPRNDDYCCISGSARELDVPENIWRICRPSAHFERHHTESLTSTPLGSSVTLFPRDQSFNIECHQNKPPTVLRAQKVFQSGLPGGEWYNYTNNSSSSQSGSIVKPRTTACVEHSISPKNCLHDPRHEIFGLEISRHTTPEPLTAYERGDSSSMGNAVPSHFPQTTAELDSTPKFPYL